MDSDDFEEDGPPPPPPPPMSASRRMGSIVVDGSVGVRSDRIARTTRGNFRISPRRTGSVHVVLEDDEGEDTSFNHDSFVSASDGERKSFDDNYESADDDDDDDDDDGDDILRQLESAKEEISALLEATRVTDGAFSKKMKDRARESDSKRKKEKEASRLSAMLKREQRSTKVHVNRRGSIDIVPRPGTYAAKEEDPSPPPPPPPPPLSAAKSSTADAVIRNELHTGPSAFGMKLQDVVPKTRYVSSRRVVTGVAGRSRYNVTSLRIPSVLDVLGKLLRSNDGLRSDSQLFRKDVGASKKRRGIDAIEKALRRCNGDVDRTVEMLRSSREKSSFAAAFDPSDKRLVASIIKTFLAKMPTRVLDALGSGDDLERNFVAGDAAASKNTMLLTHNLHVDPENVRAYVRAHVTNPHLSVLEWILDLVRDYVAASNVDAETLSISLAPTLFRSFVDDIDLERSNASLRRHMRFASIASKALASLLRDDDDDDDNDDDDDGRGAIATDNDADVSTPSKLARMSSVDIAAKVHDPEMRPVLEKAPTEVLHERLAKTGIFTPEVPSPRRHVRMMRSAADEDSAGDVAMTEEGSSGACTIAELKRALWWARRTRDWIWRGKSMDASAMASLKVDDPEVFVLLNEGSRSEGDRWDPSLAFEAEAVAFEAFLMHLRLHERKIPTIGRMITRQPQPAA